MDALACHARKTAGHRSITPDLLSRSPLASNRAVNIFIARDGAEIGEYPREELARRARAGELRPSDFYWYDGMETWQPLADLLGDKAWDARPSVPSEPVPASEPASLSKQIRLLQSFIASAWPKPQTLIWLGAGCLGFVLLATLVVHFINAGSATRAPLPPAPAKALAQPAPDPDAVRDKAAAELRQRIERLPARPAAPMNTFYYDVSVDMRRTFAGSVPWTAVIHGGENVVDLETEQTISHTDFILIADYRDGEWTFQHYRASVSDMVKSITTEIDDDERTPAPPSIAGMLGLKLSPSKEQLPPQSN